jgi:hypothetical protein
VAAAVVRFRRAALRCNDRTSHGGAAPNTVETMDNVKGGRGGADGQDRQEILENYRAQLRARVDGDTQALAGLLTEGFSLTHMTGYYQPKQEWLAQMRAGQFEYHDARERDVSLEVHGDTAELVGRIITDATVYGARANGPCS